MKLLSEYLRENHPLYGLKMVKNHQDIGDYFGDDIPLYIQQEWKNDEIVVSYIEENLKTHDFRKLQQKIQDLYKIDRFENIDNKSSKDKLGFFIYFNTEDVLDNTKNDSKFVDMLLFFNYKISEEIRDDRNLEYYLLIEPVYPKKLDDFIERYHGIAYHFTDNLTASYILKNGLKIRSKNKEKKFPRRIYLWISNQHPDCKSDKVLEFVKEVVDKTKRIKYGWCCLKVNLRDVTYDVYHDSAMLEQEAFFIYNNVAPYNIKKIFDSNK